MACTPPTPAPAPAAEGGEGGLFDPSPLPAREMRKIDFRDKVGGGYVFLWWSGGLLLFDVRLT